MNALSFATATEYQAAFDRLIAAAHRRIRIHDRNLADGDFNTVARHDSLRAFCVAGGGRRIEILLDETDTVQHHCPRLMQLLRDFGHVIEIRQTEPGSERPEHGFALADRHAVLRRHNKDDLRGSLDLDNTHDAVLLHDLFDSLWERAPVVVPATTLGLG
jgi:hypothetical protein